MDTGGSAASIFATAEIVKGARRCFRSRRTLNW